MQTLARPLPVTTEVLLSDPAPAGDGGAGVWRLENDELASVERFDVGNATVLVPTEQVLLSTVSLPLPSRAKRLAALPFAIEDRIAEPIEAVHVALGCSAGGQDWLAGVARHTLMEAWIRRLDAAGLGRAALVPDALALPVPGAESWSVELLGARALVRTADGAGFATPASMLVAAWEAAGKPAVVSYGDPLPEAMHGASATLEPEPLARRLLNPALDLRQGRYAAPRRALPVWARRLAIVIGAGLAAHLAIGIVDLIVLKRAAAAQRAETIALIQQKTPGAAIGDDLVAQATPLLPTAGGKAPGITVPLLVRAAQALAPVGPTIALQDIVLDEASGRVMLTLDPGETGRAQTVTTALANAGLAVTPTGAGTMAIGAAR